MEEKNNRHSKRICIYILILIFSIFVTGCITSNISNSNNAIKSKNISASTATIAFVSDARPELGKNLNKLTNDFNQVIPQSPTGRVDAVLMIGDMEPINTGPVNTDAAYYGSTAKSIPAFYILGNHELNNVYDIITERAKFASYPYSPNPGPKGSRNTTYSFNVGDMHVIILNEYWDGDTGGKCKWSAPYGGLNTDDSCFKYNAGDGGFIPDKLFDWIKNDLSHNTKKWTIVVGHEPLYPYGRHVKDSIDENVTNRNKLENLFISNNVTAFVGGHTHFARLETIDNILQVNAGLLGDNVGDGDNFPTITYAYVDENGHFVFDQKYGNLAWKNPEMKELVKIS